MAEASPFARVYTYHCVCTTTVLATIHDVQTLPCRQEPVKDAAAILPPPVAITSSDTIEAESVQSASSVLLNVVPARSPIIIRREDGFEKRILLKCARCKSVIGYNLDEAHFEKVEESPRPVYLLPSGMLRTVDMAKGKQVEQK
jgi:hypothetical protein